MAFELTTDAIDPKGFFDPRYTCDFDNSSPELRWASPPPGTAGFALIAEDLGTEKEGAGIQREGAFALWVVYNIPLSILHLPAGIPPQESLPNGIRQGINSLGKLGYTGPCPPLREGVHRYVFRLFALSSLPEIQARPDRNRLLEAIQPIILGAAETRGRYARIIQRAG